MATSVAPERLKSLLRAYSKRVCNALIHHRTHRTLLGEVPVDILPMQEPNKYDHIPFQYQTEAVISYPDSIVALTASQLLDIPYFPNRLRPFNLCYRCFDSLLEFLSLNLLQVFYKTSPELDFQGAPSQT